MQHRRLAHQLGNVFGNAKACVSWRIIHYCAHTKHLSLAVAEQSGLVGLAPVLSTALPSQADRNRTEIVAAGLLLDQCITAKPAVARRPDCSCRREP